MIGIQIFWRESNQPWSTMVREKNENIISTCWLKDSLWAFSFHEIFVAFKNSLEHLGCDMSLRIINLDSSIDIDSRFFVSWLIENFSFEGICQMMCNIVICERDDALGIKTSFYKNLVGVIDIGLMPIVWPGMGSCNQNCPILARAER